MRFIAHALFVFVVPLFRARIALQREIGALQRQLMVLSSPIL